MNESIMERNYTEKDFEINFDLIDYAFIELEKLGYYTNTFDSGITRKEVIDSTNSEHGTDKKLVFWIYNPDSFGVFYFQWRGNPLEIIKVLQNAGIHTVWRGKDNYPIKGCLNKRLYHATILYDYDIYDSQLEAKNRVKEIFTAMITTPFDQKSKCTIYEHLIGGGHFYEVSARIEEMLQLHKFTIDYMVKDQGGIDNLVRNLQLFNRNKKINRLIAC